ncbi:MAG TPA: ABC transporter ATP-binding protein [Pseudomonadales bacterium]
MGSHGVTGPLLAVEGLSAGFDTPDGFRPVLEDVSFTLARGQTLALVGESGSGKSFTALCLLGLLPPFGRIRSGAIRFDGVDLTTLPEPELAALRGARLSMIFQEPASALNPVFAVGWQVAEAFRLHRALTRRQARAAAEEMLAAVGIADPSSRARAYPHELSGGMRQRVMIAIALACDPEILIADEPTTALDVTVQAQIVDLLLEQQRRAGTAMLFISHDLAVVSHLADEIAVLSAGRIVERGPASRVIQRPAHPYTRALLDATACFEVDRV